MGTVCCSGRPQLPKDGAIFLGQTLQADVPSDSDHNVILWTMEQSNGEALRIVCWNILCKYGYNEQFGFCFDGYARKFEAESQYLSRLERTARHIQLFAANHQPQVVFLQECAEPGDFGHGVIFELLQEHLAPLGFQLFQEAEFVTAVKGSGDAVRLPRLQRQNQKLHVVYSKDLSCCLVNVHLLFDLKKSEGSTQTRRDVETVLQHLQELHPETDICIAGDMNRVPTAHAAVHPEAEVIEQLTSGCFLQHPPGPTNVRWDKPTDKSEMTYADFALMCPARPASG